MDADTRRTLERSHASCADPDRRRVLQALAASAALAAAGCARESSDHDERRLHDISGIDETNVARVLKPA
ncbi:hypothetical protein AB4084_14735, partial [Lysobacter sp. 2RAB21]